jgi:hypothetical protein
MSAAFLALLATYSSRCSDLSKMSAGENSFPYTWVLDRDMGEFERVVGKIDRDRDLRPFFGQVDELAFYKRALSEQEIERHYRIVRPIPAPLTRAI